MRGGLGCVALLVLSACSESAAPPDGGNGDDVQILSLSEFLGQLDPTSPVIDGGSSSEYGGLATLATYFAADRAKNPNTLLLLGPDSFGASPPLSAAFQDTPTVEGLGLLGATCDTLSNHNFDDKIPYLQRLVGQSSYPYVATNLNDVQSAVSASIHVPYLLAQAGAVTVGVLGVTDPGALDHTTPGNFGPITIAPAAPATNAAASAARAAGAQAIVVVTGLATTAVSDAGIHSGPLIDFAGALEGVDVVLGSNATNPAALEVGSVLVVEQAPRGLTYGRAELHVSGQRVASATGEVVYSSVAGVTPDPKAVALLAPYRAQLTEIYDTSVSVATGAFVLPTNNSAYAEENVVGDLVADAMLAKYAGQGAELAVINAGGVRSSLPSSYTPSNKTLRRPPTGYAAGPPYDLVIGDAYAVLPFGNACVVRSITGAALWSMLESSVEHAPNEFTGFLQIAGFRFTYSASAQVGARVQSVTLDDGTSVARDDARSWVLVDTDYLDAGGDGYGMLVESPAAIPQDLVAVALLDYIEETAPLVPMTYGRITQLP
jgi:5'-nucleotidase